MNALRKFALIGAGFLTSLTTVSALAVPFAPVLDEFWIVKNSAEIFRDSFDDGAPPPSGPDGASTYVMVGAGGITSEASGKLTMTPLLGEPTLITTTFADISTAGLRALSTNPANPDFLGFDSSFEIHGLFDMSNLPLITGQSFGVRANDRAPSLGNDGDNTFGLFVGVSNLTGEVGVFLRLNDFTTNSSVVLWSDTSIDSLLSGADQIELVLSKDASSSLLNASYSLYDYDLANPVLHTASLLNAGAIYNGEDYIRAQFISTDQVSIPEPATLALLGLGLAGLAFARTRNART